LLSSSNLVQPPRRHAVGRFDRQAERFDRRAGLAPGVAREVAMALVRTVSLRADDVVLEIGAGTGAIGCELLQLGPRYVGLDLSHRMLDVFRRKLVSCLRGSQSKASDAGEDVIGGFDPHEWLRIGVVSSEI
jgi:ubiquinone/menaquinone biosynthesis C-methylase UbiE